MQSSKNRDYWNQIISDLGHLKSPEEIRRGILNLKISKERVIRKDEDEKQTLLEVVAEHLIFQSQEGGSEKLANMLYEHMKRKLQKPDSAIKQEEGVKCEKEFLNELMQWYENDKRHSQEPYDQTSHSKHIIVLIKEFINSSKNKKECASHVLHWAVTNDLKDLVELLLEQGADRNTSHPTTGVSPSYYAQSRDMLHILHKSYPQNNSQLRLYSCYDIMRVFKIHGLKPNKEVFVVIWQAFGPKTRAALIEKVISKYSDPYNAALAILYTNFDPFTIIKGKPAIEYLENEKDTALRKFVLSAELRLLIELESEFLINPEGEAYLKERIRKLLEYDPEVLIYNINCESLFEFDRPFKMPLATQELFPIELALKEENWVIAQLLSEQSRKLTGESKAKFIDIFKSAVTYKIAEYKQNTNQIDHAKNLNSKAIFIAEAAKCAKLIGDETLSREMDQRIIKILPVVFLGPESTRILVSAVNHPLSLSLQGSSVFYQKMWEASSSSFAYFWNKSLIQLGLANSIQGVVALTCTAIALVATGYVASISGALEVAKEYSHQLGECISPASGIPLVN
ncbi:MAG: hypothetical protein K0R73_651 [Candidatus Midichloriaceae bacterium]|jgi:hypothetical protein|nr:hypothetical protein [Candidatus Midichloriaceae bacterium]